MFMLDKICNLYSRNSRNTQHAKSTLCNISIQCVHEDYPLKNERTERKRAQKRYEKTQAAFQTSVKFHCSANHYSALEITLNARPKNPLLYTTQSMYTQRRFIIP